MDHDTAKLEIVRSILRFFREEMDNPLLDVEQKDSLEVAKQCLESTYEIDSEDRLVRNALDLCTMFHIPTKVTDETVKSAEELKVLGNDLMKNGKYNDALDLYTRAIDLNPHSNILYCNRAAAYSRLDKHWNAIADCRESIRLSPTAKAYGRLGVAYSNLEMYEEAKEAYAKAHALDPSNDTYEQNMKLADEYLNPAPSAATATQTSTSAIPGIGGIGGLDFNQLLSNPTLITMASQMVSDPAFVTMTQQLAQHMHVINPDLMNSVQQTISGLPTGNPPAGGDAGDNATNPPEDPTTEDKKE